MLSFINERIVITSPPFVFILQYLQNSHPLHPLIPSKLKLKRPIEGEDKKPRIEIPSSLTTSPSQILSPPFLSPSPSPSLPLRCPPRVGVGVADWPPLSAPLGGRKPESAQLLLAGDWDRATPFPLPFCAIGVVVVGVELGNDLGRQSFNFPLVFFIHIKLNIRYAKLCFN